MQHFFFFYRTAVTLFCSHSKHRAAVEMSRGWMCATASQTVLGESSSHRHVPLLVYHHTEIQTHTSSQWTLPFMSTIIYQVFPEISEECMQIKKEVFVVLFQTIKTAHLPVVKQSAAVLQLFAAVYVGFVELCAQIGWTIRNVQHTYKSRIWKNKKTNKHLVAHKRQTKLNLW